MTLEAVLFDVGGTLLHEQPSRFAIYAEAARARGRNVTEKTMERMMRNAHRELPRRLGGAFRYSDPWFRAFIRRIFGQNLGLPGPTVDAVAEELFERFEAAETFRVHAGVRELLAELAGRGLRLGVVSNWSERLPRVLAAVGLDGWFDAVLCSATEEVEKPDAEIFRRALERLDVRGEAAVHVGDHPRRDGGAAALGIEVVLVDHGAQEGLGERGAVRDFAELRARLGARLGA